MKIQIVIAIKKTRILRKTLIKNQPRMTWMSILLQNLVGIVLITNYIFFTYKNVLKLVKIWNQNPPMQARQLIENLIHVAPGPSAEARQEIATIIDSFTLFLTDQIITLIVHYTNLHAEVVYRYQLEDGLYLQNWIRTENTEMRGFLGLLMLAVVLRSQRELIEFLWQNDESFQRAIFPATMSRTRFWQL